MTGRALAPTRDARRPLAAVVVAIVAGLAGGAGRARAQAAPVGASIPVSGAPAADASVPAGVTLRLGPRVGDTLHTRFEQVIRLEARGASGFGTRPMTSRLVVHGHTSVEAPAEVGWLVATTTDSVAIVAPDMSPRAIEASRRALLASRTRMHVAPDGGMTVLGDAMAAALGVAPGAGQPLPGTLPGTAVRPGARWTRAVPMPWGATGDPVAPGEATPQLEVTFRLDSATSDGARAWISMQGSVQRLRTLRAPSTRGTMRGALVVDLARGWVVDSRATFELDALLPVESEVDRMRMIPVHVTVTQRLRAR